MIDFQNSALNIWSKFRNLPVAQLLGIAGLAMLALVLLFVTQCSKSLEAEIEKTWPKQDLKSVKTLIAQQTSDRLFELSPRPAVMMFVSKDQALGLINGNLARLPELSNLNVEFDAGYILAKSDFKVMAERGAPSEAQDYVVTGHLDAALAPYVDADNVARFRIILVKLKDIKIDGNKGQKIPRLVRDYLAKLLSSRLNIINGIFNSECSKAIGAQIIKVPSCFVQLPTNVPVNVDVVKSLAGQPQTQAVTGNAVDLPIKIDTASAFVAPSGIYVTADAHLLDDPTWKPHEPSGEKSTKSLGELAAIFDRQFSDRLGLDYTTSRVTEGLDTALVARVLASITSKTNLHLIQAFASTPEPFDTDVRLAKKPSFSCDRSSCSRQECRAPRCEYRDDRICHGDIGNFFCRTVQNLVCEPANAAGNLVCNTIQEVGAGSCNVFEEIKKGGCEANKAFVDKALGKVGRVSGDYSVVGDYDVHLLTASSSDDLQRLSISAIAGASAKAKGSLRFEPLDQGHILLCVSKWQEGFEVGVNLPPVERNLSASFTQATVTDDGIDLTYTLDKFALDGQVSPSPFDAVFTQHPYLRINCSIAAGIGELARLVHIVDPENDIVPDELNEAVTGKVHKEVDDAKFEIRIPNLKQRMGDTDEVLKPSLRSTAIVFRLG